MTAVPELSVVVPVFNEEAALQALFDRLYPALDKLGLSYEILFINDGSRDRSAAILKDNFCSGPMSPGSSCSTATSDSTWPSSPASNTRAEGGS